MSALKTYNPVKLYTTPWDEPAEEEFPRASVYTAEEPPAPAHPVSPGGIYLHGMYLCDPQAVTPKDVRRFWWAGLELLNTEVKKRGLSASEIRNVMLPSFDTFHDAANDLWETMRQLVARGGIGLPSAVGVEVRCQIVTSEVRCGSGTTIFPPLRSPEPPHMEETAAAAQVESRDTTPAVEEATASRTRSALEGVRRAFYRRAEQVRAYQEEMSRDADALLDD